MLAIIGVITIGIVIFLWEGMTLLKQKMKKEMVVFTSSLLLAVTLHISIVLHLPLPTLAQVIGTMLSPVVKPIVGWLEGGSA
jgi:hypothetical protein